MNVPENPDIVTAILKTDALLRSGSADRIFNASAAEAAKMIKKMREAEIPKPEILALVVNI